MLVSELVMWVALGRVPEMELTESREHPGKFEWIDWRRDDGVGDDGAPDVISVPFSQAEFAILELDINYEEYIDLWSKVGNQTGAEILVEHKNFVDRFGKTSPSEAEKLGILGDQEAQVNANLADILRNMELPFEPLPPPSEQLSPALLLKVYPEAGGTG